MNSDKLTLLLGLAGMGVIVVGGVMLFQNKAKLAAQGVGRSPLGRGKLVDTRFMRKAEQIDGFNDGNMQTQLLSDSEMPIEQRLAMIQTLIAKSVQDPEMRKLALKITSKCPERDGTCEARAIYQYVKAHVRYTGDIGPIALKAGGEAEGIDLYQSARRTVEMGGGDCDDQSILVATLLALNGLEPRLRVTGESKGADPSHIYPGVLLPKNNSNGDFTPMDTTLPGNNRFGYEVPYGYKLDFAG